MSFSPHQFIAKWSDATLRERSAARWLFRVVARTHRTKNASNAFRYDFDIALIGTIQHFPKGIDAGV